MVAVSGGADSLCLLGLLLDMQSSGHQLAPAWLGVAHLDHELRGTSGTADAQAVAELAESLHLPFFGERSDVASLARSLHRSLEDAARQARYAFLRRIALQSEADCICVGHTADDQVETMVMHWLRGSGLRGLVGMSPLREGIARPLLCIRHADTLDYCRERGWQPCQDETNDEIRYYRNRIRHELLPYLESYNPNLRQTLLRNAELLAGDEAYLRQESDHAYGAACLLQSATTVVLDLPALRKLAPALAHLVIRRAAVRLDAENGEGLLEAKHIFDIEKLFQSKHTGARLSLPSGLVAELGYSTLAFRKESSAAPQPDFAPPTSRLPLPVPGERLVPELGWRFRTTVSDVSLETQAHIAHRARAAGTESCAVYPIETSAYLDAGLAGSELFVRTWRSGDRFRPLGMQREKKLHDFFVDARIPRGLRHQIPLVENPAHLLWVAGLRLDDRVRVTTETKRILTISMEPL